MSNFTSLKSDARNVSLKIFTGVFLLLTLFTFSKAFGLYGGQEFQVNTYISGAQDHPSVAVFNNGNFVVVWSSWEQDGDHRGVYGQIFDSTGSKTGSEFLVNTCTSDGQQDPSVTVLSNDNFIVSWESHDQDGEGWGVYAQIFDASGDKSGNEFKVNDYTSANQKDSNTIALMSGQFLVTWISQFQDTSGYGVYGKVFDSSGTEIVGEFRANTYTNDDQGGAGSFDQRGSSAALLSNGNFVIVWNSAGQDTSDNGVYGRIFNSSGTEIVEEFPINTHITDSQTSPSVTALTDNDTFVVTWESNDQDGDGWGVYGQIFNNNGTKVGGEFLVNTNTTNHQFHHTTATLENDKFIVVWINYTEANLPHPSVGYSVSAQVFDASGNKLGNEFQVNTSTSFQYYHYPSVVKLENSNFVIVWPSNQDVDSWGVYGRIFEIHPPTISEIVKSGKKNTLLRFSAKDFTDAFEDADGDSLVQIQVMSLPNNGDLKLSNFGVVVEDQVIVANDLDNLVFDPDADWVGETNFGWRGHDGMQYSDATEEITITIDPDWLEKWWPVITGTTLAVVGIVTTVTATVVGGLMLKKCKKCCCKEKERSVELNDKGQIVVKEDV